MLRSKHSRASSKNDIGIQALNLNQVGIFSSLCVAKCIMRYEEEGDDNGEEYGHNKEIAMLEMYSQNARGEAHIVHAMVDKQDEEVLIFKSFTMPKKLLGLWSG